MLRVSSFLLFVALPVIGVYGECESCKDRYGDIPAKWDRVNFNILEHVCLNNANDVHVLNGYMRTNLAVFLYGDIVFSELFGARLYTNGDATKPNEDVLAFLRQRLGEAEAAGRIYRANQTQIDTALGAIIDILRDAATPQTLREVTVRGLFEGDFFGPGNVSGSPQEKVVAHFNIVHGKGLDLPFLTKPDDIKDDNGTAVPNPKQAIRDLFAGTGGQTAFLDPAGLGLFTEVDIFRKKRDDRTSPGHVTNTQFDLYRRACMLGVMRGRNLAGVGGPGGTPKINNYCCNNGECYTCTGKFCSYAQGGGCSLGSDPCPPTYPCP